VNEFVALTFVNEEEGIIVMKCITFTAGTMRFLFVEMSSFNVERIRVNSSQVLPTKYGR
jgi:hypothetical protein